MEDRARFSRLQHRAAGPSILVVVFGRRIVADNRSRIPLIIRSGLAQLPGSEVQTGGRDRDAAYDQGGREEAKPESPSASSFSHSRRTRDRPKAQSSNCSLSRRRIGPADSLVRSVLAT